MAQPAETSVNVIVKHIVVSSGIGADEGMQLLFYNKKSASDNIFFPKRYDCTDIIEKVYKMCLAAVLINEC